MLRTNKSTAAPVGTAMVFLGLAALTSFSMGSRIDHSFQSRWNSVGDAWRQLGGVFLAVYQPGNAGQFLALSYSTKSEVPNAQTDSTECVSQIHENVPFDETEPKLSGLEAEAELTLSPAPTKRLASARPRVTSGVSSIGASATASVTKRLARVQQSLNRVSLGPLEVLRIDLAEVVSLALKTDEAERLVNAARAEYKINPRLEMTKLIKWPPAPPARTMKRGPSPNCEGSDQPTKKPGARYVYKISTRV
jgi:hypothetical protein